MITAKGLVVGRRELGESDCFIDILTAEHGVIEFYARGVRKITSKNNATTQLFAYAEYCIDERKERYYLNSSEPIRSFFKLRLDMQKCSLACYLIEIAQYCATSGQTAKDIMRLLLNSLYLLSEGMRTPEFLKSVFEMRFMSEIGMLPQLIGCRDCYRYTTDRMYMMIDRACLLCGEDFDRRGFEENYYHILLSDTALHTLRYICLIDQSKVFNFRVSQSVQDELTEICEKYIIERLGAKFQTLDFYKQIKDTE